MKSLIFENDVESVLASPYVDWPSFHRKTFFVTGTTGLIGTLLVHSLLAANRKFSLNLRVLALARNENKAQERLPREDALEIILGDVCDLPMVEEPVDYIIHAASLTSSKAFIESPVEVAKTALNGTMNVLELAKQKDVESFVYLSSMEVYGTPQTDEKVPEDHGTDLNPMKPRSCYPESKRMCESLCAGYCSEYGVPAKVLCLTQTFGPGIGYNDGRVFAEFARCAVEEKNIVLHTKGETKRNYLYTADAVTAILAVLLKGKAGEKYNAANENTYCSIYEMARFVADKCCKGKIGVEIEEENVENRGYAPTLHMNLNTEKLKGLGWQATVNLQTMYENLISYLKEL